jgi:hypothetical protein
LAGGSDKYIALCLVKLVADIMFVFSFLVSCRHSVGIVPFAEIYSKLAAPLRMPLRKRQRALALRDTMSARAQNDEPLLLELRATIRESAHEPDLTGSTNGPSGLVRRPRTYNQDG